MCEENKGLKGKGGGEGGLGESNHHLMHGSSVSNNFQAEFLYPVSLWYGCFAVDISAYHRGFHGDLNETLFVGEVDDASKELVKTTHECLSLAIDEGV